MKTFINKRFLFRISIVIGLNLAISASVFGQREIKMAAPAPKGILIFTGMELANGNKVESYTVERSYDKRQWEKLAELRTPVGWDVFRANFEKWKPDFGFQGFPKNDDLKIRWQKCETANVIDSMGYWAASTTIRLAANIAYYDQSAARDKKVWYRVKALKNGKTVSENVSEPVQYPFVPQYDAISLSDKNVDKAVFYLKWQSEGTNPAPYFGIRYYENEQLKDARGSLAKYSIGATTYYIFQDSTRYLKADRQYFLNPVDVYGNPGVGTDIVPVSALSADKTFYQRTRAVTDPKGMGVILSWRLQNTKHIIGITIYKSDSYDKKEYEPVATIPATDTAYTDRKVVPDKMYYYYLETVSAQNDLSRKSNIFFNAGYDRLKPVYPSISRAKNKDKGTVDGVTVLVKASEMNLAGVRIFRSDGFSPKLYPITDILKLTNNEVIYTDTSQVLSGDRSYLYAATAVNTSSVESSMSDTITIQPNIKTLPPSPNRLSAYEESGAVNLVWEDVKTRHRATSGYNVLRRDLPDGKLVQLNAKDIVVNVPTYADKTVQPGKNYEYAVQTVDDLGGVSESMALYPIAVKEIQLPAPPNVWLTREAGRVIVQWAEYNTNTPMKLNLYRYQRGAKPQLLKTFLPDERKYEDAKVKKGDLYFYFTTFTDDKKNESSRSQEAGSRID